MLSHLRITNFVLIDKLELEFHEGLNVFTGETGAGKSLVMKALNLLMGARTEGKVCRRDNENTIVEAIFNLENRPDIIRDINSITGLELDDDEHEIIIRRFITASNRSTAKLNNMGLTMAMLKKLGSLLIHIHNQHHTQKLLKKENHLAMLDSFGTSEHAARCEKFKKLFEKNLIVKKEIQALKQALLKRERELDILEYQAREIDELDFENLDENEINEKRKIQSNHEEIISTVNRIIEDMNSNYDEGIIAKFDGVITSLNRISDLSDKLLEINNVFEQARIEMEEGLRLIEDFNDTLSWNPQEAADLDALISSLEDLKRKFGPKIEDILDYRTKIDEKIKAWNSLENNLRDLEEQFSDNQKVLYKTGKKISDERKQMAKKLKKALETELFDLGITHPVIELNLSSTQENFNSSGMDKLDFMAAFNKGEKTVPIEKTASGGELSRVMLCLKKIFQDSAGTTMVFDEIDTGISGKTAEMAGRKMLEISENTQILVITHLPQIASMGNAHFLVKKVEGHENVFTDVSCLNREERITALADMLGSKGKTAFAHAKRLLKENHTE
jgi:DNA repair protein RecN (Recombination protein N)